MSKNHYGHIEHESVDMDTHDRAVRKSSGKHSRSGNQSAPLWLICLLLFVGLLGFFLIRIPARMKASIQPEPAAPAAANTELLPAQSLPEAQLLPEDDTVTVAADDGSAMTEAAVIEQEPAELLIEATPEPTPEAPQVHVHSFVRGVCSVCGAKPEFLTDWLPDEFYKEAEHQGTVTGVEYDTKAYGSYVYTSYHKRMVVYLPYGYDETKPYNVLFLICGQGDNENSWLISRHEKGSHVMRGRLILDNIFEKGIAEPCIVVTPAAETNLVQGLTAGIVQLQDEIRETILPYIVEHYSTYAKDSSLKSLQEAREHFGLGGLSNGALFTFEGGMRHNFDLFANYCAFSGNGEPWKTVDLIQQGSYAELPVNCFFAGAGTMNDWQQHYTEIGYEHFLEQDERFTEGENSWRVDVEGGHEWKVWYTCLYNAMQVMFQSRG